MKKILALLSVVIMIVSLTACGSGSGNTDAKKNIAVTTDNWDDYLEFVVETDDSEGFLNFHLYLQAKEGVVISNETNTNILFSYNADKQHYTKENNKVILGECEAIEDTYTMNYYMYGNQNKEGYRADIDVGVRCSFEEGDRWTIIPKNFVITGIEGTININ